MEKKTKKIEEVVLKDQDSIVSLFRGIFYVLVIIAVLIGALLIVEIVKNGTLKTEAVEEVKNNEYDVSMFDTLSTTDAITKINEGGTKVVYIGRSTCGFCVKFLPIIQQAQKEFGYKTIYIDLEKTTEEDRNKLIKFDNEEKFIEENFGYTPLILIFENGKFKKGRVGYSEYDTFKAFLTENGISK